MFYFRLTAYTASTWVSDECKIIQETIVHFFIIILGIVIGFVSLRFSSVKFVIVSCVEFILFCIFYCLFLVYFIRIVLRSYLCGFQYLTIH